MKIEVGKTIHKNSKQGGGSYTVTGVVNCSRCETELELREVVEPNKRQRKRGRWYAEYSWCHKCGLYEPNKESREIVNKKQV